MSQQVFEGKVQGEEGCSQLGKSLTSSSSTALELPDNNDRAHQIISAATHIRRSDRYWQPVCLSAPVYVFSSSQSSFSHSPLHFFINVCLSFPNRKPIHTYALINSGCMDSCISDCFADRHSLPHHFKPIPVPILAVDDYPIALGLVTQDVLTNLLVDKHSENISLSVVSVAFPVILGLDWLRCHNPAVDWSNPLISLSCCNLSCSNRVLVRPKGFGLDGHFGLSVLQACLVTRVGLGLGLCANSPCSSRPMQLQLPPHPPTSTLPPTTLFLSFMTQWTGYGCSSLDDVSLHPKPKITMSNINCFKKYSKNHQICLLCFHPVNSAAYIAAVNVNF